MSQKKKMIQRKVKMETGIEILIVNYEILSIKCKLFKFTHKN